MGYRDRVKSLVIRIYLSTHEFGGPVMALVHENFAWNADAPENISSCAVVAADPVHEEMSWLNAEARSNIPYIEVIFAVFQLPMSWLNTEA